MPRNKRPQEVQCARRHMLLQQGKLALRTWLFLPRLHDHSLLKPTQKKGKRCFSARKIENYFNLL
jgi:hypothetical protein